MKLSCIPFLFILLFSVDSFAQTTKSWRDHNKSADTYYATGRYEDAAKHYKQAWNKKKRKTYLINKAGECFFLVKDFKNAAAAFIHVKDDTKDFPQAAMMYAKSLKQNGNYSQAISEFRQVIDSYVGEDRQNVLSVAANEIKGAEMALSMMDQPQQHDITHLGKGINSKKSDFAPIPLNDQILYFSSTKRGNQLKIFFSKKEDGIWSKSTMPKKFPSIQAEHYGNGSFSKDLKTFYFTICGSKSKKDLRSICEIHAIKYSNDSWSDPIKLRDYINDSEATTTHPSVVQIGDKEILYFSSNRKGGQGGMDIWYCERNKDSKDFDFTFPVNAGTRINSPGNEITPFITEEGTLYYSSDGLVSAGGYDVFSSKQNGIEWSSPINLGMPINSCADDFYYTMLPSGSGYFASNRTFGSDKEKTTHEDIFFFQPKDGAASEQLLAKGKILSENDQDLIPMCDIILSEVFDGAIKSEINTFQSEDGLFQFALEANKEYLIKTKKNNFQDSEYYFNTFGVNTGSLDEISIYMESSMPIVDASKTNQTVSESATASTNELILESSEDSNNNIPSSSQEEITIAGAEPSLQENSDDLKELSLTELKTETQINEEGEVGFTYVEIETPAILSESNSISETPSSVSETSSASESTSAPKAPSASEAPLTIESSSSIESNNSLASAEHTASNLAMEKASATEAVGSSHSVQKFSMYQSWKLNSDTPEPTSTDTYSRYESHSESFSNSSTTNSPNEHSSSYETLVMETAPMNSNSSAGSYTYTMSHAPYYSITSEANKDMGTCFKVQFIALKNRNKSFSVLEDVGSIETELINDRNLTRYLVSRFYSKDEAKQAMRNIRSRGYKGAFMVEYLDGYRVKDLYK